MSFVMAGARLALSAVSRRQVAISAPMVRGFAQEGTVKDAGDSFKKRESASEAAFIKNLEANQLKNLKSSHETEIMHREAEIKRHKEAIERHKDELKKLESADKK